MNKNIPFNRFYKIFNLISITLIVLSLILLIFKGLNFGIDFKGGTLIELRTLDNKITISDLRKSFNQLNLGDVSVKKFGKDNDYIVKFENLKTLEKNNYRSLVGHFQVLDKKKLIIKNLNPEIRFYNQPETITYEASIKTSFFSDTYLTMSNIDRSEYYNIKFQHKPLMIWIWISVLLLSFGGFLSLFKNAKNN